MAIQLNASSEYLTRTTGLLNYNSPYTFMAYVRINTLSSSDCVWVLSDATTSNRDILMLNATDGTTMALRVTNGGTATTQNDTTTLETGVWYHLALVRSSTDLTLYMNGIPALINTRDITSRAAITQMRIGLDQSGSNAATIDVAYARAWASALTQAEIAVEKLSTTAVKASAYGEWPLTADADDDSGNARHWTVSGTPAYVSSPVLTDQGVYYSLWLDTERDETYGSTLDNITAYWTGQSQWSFGLQASLDVMAQPASMTFQLSNVNGVFNQEVTGAELITNGDFTNWTADNPNNWTVSGESGTDPEISEVGAEGTHTSSGNGACNFYDSTGTLYIQSSSFTPVVGHRYRVSLEVTAFQSSGGIVVKNGTTAISPVYHTEGQKVFTFTATDTTFRIYAYPGGGRTNMTIDNVSVIETALYYDCLRVGTLVRLRVADNISGQTVTLFEAPIGSVKLSIGSAGDRLVNVTLQDYNTDILNAEYTPPLMTSVTTDVPIQHVFDLPVVPIPYGENYWMLEREGSSELGVTTYLYDHNSVLLDTGATTLEYSGDVADKGSAQRGISPMMFIEDATNAEAGGRFFYNPRTRQYTFHSRNRDPQNDTAPLSLSAAEWATVDYQYGDSIINDLTLHYIPRKAGSAGSVVWTSEETPIELKNGQSRKITARYRSASDNAAKVGVLTGIQPQAGTDYTANSNSDGGGEDLSELLTVSNYFGAANAELWIANNSGRDLYVTLLQLRGTPLTQFDEQTHNYNDPNSIARHRLKPKQMSLRMLNSKSLVEQYATYLVNRYSEPITHVATVTFSANKSSANMTAALTYTIGDRIAVSDSWSGHDKDYIIIGEQHTLTVANSTTSQLETYPHDVTWMLKPISRDTLWILETVGKSELGLTTRLGF